MFEHCILNKAVKYIAHDHLSIGLASIDRGNALLQYADEADLALISAQFSNQVAKILNIEKNIVII